MSTNFEHILLLMSAEPITCIDVLVSLLLVLFQLTSLLAQTPLFSEMIAPISFADEQHMLMSIH